MQVDLNQKIELSEAPILASQVEAFREATCTENTQGIPLTFVTRLRHSEFQWFARVGAQLNQVLHTEQEYEFLEDAQIGDELKMVTQVESLKERKMGTKKMIFMTLKGELKKGEKVLVISRSSFVIQPPA